MTTNSETADHGTYSKNHNKLSKQLRREHGRRHGDHMEGDHWAGGRSRRGWARYRVEEGDLAGFKKKMDRGSRRTA